MTIPRVLYKCVVPERIDVLVNKRVRFTQPRFLNDPFEFRPGMPVADVEGLGHFEKKIAKKRHAGYQEMARVHGVLSLTEKNYSIPMWAHYAAAHTGFAIGFCTESSLLRRAVAEGKLQKVRYQQDRVSLTRGLPGKPYVGPEEILWTKSTDWEYEQEWRWLESGDPYEYSQVTAASNGELLFLRPIPSDSIRQIVLGNRTDSRLAESIIALKSTGDYRHLELFRVTLNESSYKLDVEPL